MKKISYRELDKGGQKGIYVILPKYLGIETTFNTRLIISLLSSYKKEGNGRT